MRISRFLLLLSLLLSFQANAQFLIGWCGGYATPHELNREIYIYNEINSSNLTKKMKEVHWYQGPQIGFRYGEERFGEFTYSRKRAMVRSEFDSAGISMTREMKVFCNTINFGFGIAGDGWRIGASFDFGRFKAFGRRDQTSLIKEEPWRRIWVINNTRIMGIAMYRLYLTETIFVDRTVGRFDFRLYAQLFGMKKELDGLDYWLFGTQLNYGLAQEERFTNYGITVFINLKRN